MRYLVKAFAVFSVLFLIAFQNTAISGTIDNATLSPSSALIQVGTYQEITFSAINDKSFALKDYHIKIKYDDGLTVNNVAVSPSATKAEIYPKRNLIELKWEGIPSNTELKASFNVSGGVGTYTLVPSSIVYHDYNHKRYLGTCNTSTIKIRTELIPPSPPRNTRSISGEGFISIYWSSPPDEDIAGYNIYRRTSISSYININPSLIDRYTSEYSDSNIQNGITYYYVVTAVDTSGNESAYSVETAETYYDLKIRSYEVPSVSMVAVGDINGDGQPDIAFGFPKYCSGGGKNSICGKMEIYYGGNTTGSPDITLYSGEGGDFGRVATIVDLNSDGYDELIVSAPYYTPPDTYWQNEAGKIYIYSGGPQIDTTPVFTMIGRQSFGDGGDSVYLIAENLGFSISPAEDLNGDGHNDILIGAPLGGMDRSGSVVILFGGPNLSNPGTYRFSGSKAWEEMGYSVSAVGDLNGDGYSDFLTGGPGSFNNPFGSAYLFYGGQYVSFPKK